VSQIYLKLDDPANTDALIASLNKLLPGTRSLSMQDLLTQISVENIPGLSTFINVMVGIAIVIAFAVVCLSMYMAVLAADARDRHSEIAWALPADMCSS